jgi:hypothetical protein
VQGVSSWLSRRQGSDSDLSVGETADIHEFKMQARDSEGLARSPRCALLHL